MHEILKKLAKLVEAGKIDKNSPFPPDLKGQDGADEKEFIYDIAKVDPHQYSTYRLYLRFPKVKEYKWNHLYKYTQILEFLL